jgi:hypothetical protein
MRIASPAPIRADESSVQTCSTSKEWTHSVRMLAGADLHRPARFDDVNVYTALGFRSKTHG